MRELAVQSDTDGDAHEYLKFIFLGLRRYFGVEKQLGMSGRVKNSKKLVVPWAQEFCRNALVKVTGIRRQRPSGRATTDSGTSGTVFCDEKSKWEREPLKR